MIAHGSEPPSRRTWSSTPSEGGPQLPRSLSPGLRRRALRRGHVGVRGHHRGTRREDRRTRRHPASTPSNGSTTTPSAESTKTSTAARTPTTPSSAPRSRTCRTPALRPIATGPYHAARIILSDLGTKGGVRTDADARVLRNDGTAIDGLYAAGNTSASLSGKFYPGPGVPLRDRDGVLLRAALHMMG